MVLDNPRRPRFWSVLPGSTVVFNANAPVAWTDLDLTGFMSVKSGVVLLKVLNGNVNVNNVYFRMNGDGSIINTSISVAQINLNSGVYILCPVNAGIVEWWADNADPMVVHALCWLET